MRLCHKHQARLKEAARSAALPSAGYAQAVEFCVTAEHSSVQSSGLAVTAPRPAKPRRCGRAPPLPIAYQQLWQMCSQQPLVVTTCRAIFILTAAQPPPTPARPEATTPAFTSIRCVSHYDHNSQRVPTALPRFTHPENRVIGYSATLMCDTHRRVFGAALVTDHSSKV